MARHRTGKLGVQNSEATWAGGSRETLGRCPVCDSPEREVAHEDLRDWFFKCSDDDWVMWRCDGCTALYLDPRPNAASIGYAYRNYYTHSDDVEAKPVRPLERLAWATINGYLNRRFGLQRRPTWTGGFWIFSVLLPLRYKLDYYGRHLPRVRNSGRMPRLLDIGCGSGAFLLRAQEMGWTPTGVEFDPKAVEVCRTHSLDVYCGDITALPPQNSGFDAITMNHTLEHLPDTRDCLQRCHALLASGGKLWITVPNPSSLGHRLFGRSWRGLEAPRHLCLFPPECLVQLLRDAGFRNVKLIRRGAHSPKSTRESAQIVATRGLPRWSALRIRLLRLTIDLLATLSPRLGEEMIVTATRG